MSRTMPPNRLGGMSFKRKLLISYVIMIVIPIVSLGLYAYSISKRNLENQMLRNAEASVQTMANQLNLRVEKYYGIMDSVIYNRGIQNIFAGEYTDLTNLYYDLENYFGPSVSTIIGLNKDIVLFSVYTENRMPEYGENIRSSARVADKLWYRKALQSVEPAWFHEASALIFASKFPDFYNKEFPSVVSIQLNERLLFEVLDIVGAESFGVEIWSRESELLFVDDWLEDVQAGEFLLLTEPIQRSGWTMNVYVPLEQVRVNETEIITATAVVAGISLALLTVLSWVFSNMLTKPLNRLNQKMEFVEGGDLSVVVDSAANDEIGVLTRRFGNMLVKINELIREGYQNKIDRQKAEMKALQAQIHPHFLYNTLSVIRWKALQANEEEIAGMVHALAKFYRTALNKGRSVIPVRDEIDNIQSYIEIIRLVKDYDFDVFYELEPSLHESRMINMILQPVVENAIVHGVAKIRTGRGVLKISGSASGDAIRFTVEDNGPGMSADKQARILSEYSGGYGLRNVNERIRLAYGDRCGISLDGDEGDGLRVTITLRTSPADSAGEAESASLPLS